MVTGSFNREGPFFIFKFMKMKYSGLLAVIIATIELTGCYSKIKDTDPFAGENIHKTNFKLDHLSIDSIFLDSTSTSFNGTLHVYKNDLLLVDNQFCWVFRFDRNGRFISRNIGQGDGASELPCRRITSYVSLPNGGHMFLGPSWDVYLFDSNFVKVADYRVDWHSRGNKEYVATHPDPTDPIMYSITSGIQQIRADKKYVYLPLFSQHKLFNPIVDAYSREARILGKMDIESGDVKELFGRLSPIYQQNKQTRTFSYLYYDLIHENEMAIMYPVDSLIYLFSKDFTLVKKFGSAGRMMDTNYKGTSEYDKMGNTWVKENRDKGYYTAIDFNEARNLIFRSYQKSGSSLSDGLQIYREDELLADVDIPRKCKIVGYISPFFYLSKGPDDASGQVKIYRFQLPF